MFRCACPRPVQQSQATGRLREASSEDTVDSFALVLSDAFPT